MTKFLLAVHVLAAIVAVGPVTVAASMFPPAARRALDPPPDGPRAADAVARVATVGLLHRICRVYAVVGVVVPVFGFATAKNMGVLGDAWLIASIVLTALAAAVLVVLVLPRQEAVVRGLLPEGAGDAGAAAAAAAAAAAGDGPAAGATGVTAGVAAAAATVRGAVTVTRRDTVRLAMFTGVFNLLWAAVTVLMIVRPGSTTGA
ncbi:protease [Streptomyces anandii]|uniref:Protease n=1 Tax=Streptomyces anandii TaxID=285454 RepID=A0ABW6H7Y5_9ACTN